MKHLVLAITLASIPIVSSAQQTSFSNSVSQYAQNIGSKVTIQLQSNKPSSFSGNFAQTFSYQNGATNFTRNFNFGGTTNFNITSTINNNTTTFTNNPKFKW